MYLKCFLAAAGYSEEEADRLTSLISKSVHNLTALLQDVRDGELKGNDCKLIFAKSELNSSEWHVHVVYRVRKKNIPLASSQ